MYADPSPPAVRTETDGPVSTIVLSRPQCRNAVDGPTATLLREAFERFEAEPEPARTAP